MDYYLSIKKKNLVYVASQLLTIKESTLNQLQGVRIYENSDYLVLSPSNMTEKELIGIQKECLYNGEAKHMQYVRYSNICSSIKLKDLKDDREKYKKLAQWILSLKYPFTQVKEIEDMYGEHWISLFN